MMKRLGDAELEIMLAVWGAGGPVQSGYIHQQLRGSRDWALPYNKKASYNFVTTLLFSLEYLLESLAFPTGIG